MGPFIKGPAPLAWYQMKDRLNWTTFVISQNKYERCVICKNYRQKFWIQVVHLSLRFRLAKKRILRQAMSRSTVRLAPKIPNYSTLIMIWLYIYKLDMHVYDFYYQDEVLSSSEFICSIYLLTCWRSPVRINARKDLGNLNSWLQFDLQHVLI